MPKRRSAAMPTQSAGKPVHQDFELIVCPGVTRMSQSEKRAPLEARCTVVKNFPKVGSRRHMTSQQSLDRAFSLRRNRSSRLTTSSWIPATALPALWSIARCLGASCLRKGFDPLFVAPDSYSNAHGYRSIPRRIHVAEPVQRSRFPLACESEVAMRIC